MRVFHLINTAMLCAVLALAADQASAQPTVSAPPASDAIPLRAGIIDKHALPDFIANPPRVFDPDEHYIVQLDAPITPAKRARLERIGIELLEYVSSNAYLARLDNAAPAVVAAEQAVHWIAPFQDDWKIDPRIGQRLIPFQTPERILIDAVGQYQLIASLFPRQDLDAAMEELARDGADVIGGTQFGEHGFIDLIVEQDAIPDLARSRAVQYLEEAPEPVMRNDTTEWIIQSNASGQTPIWDQGLHGQDQIGGIIDGPPKESHCSFDDSVSPGPTHRKFLLYTGPIGSDAHGTHTTATFAGDQAPFGVADQFDGMAFAARLAFSPVNPIFSSPATFITRLSDAHNAGAHVHSNSWGDDGTTAYTTWCRQIDLFSFSNEDDLVCFAVTNTTTLKSPENAKNVLAVAASQDTPNQGSFCSGGLGPTFDGRRKPEIFAPGCGTQSASSATTCGWFGLTGTSMACPAVSGMGLLVRQYYTEGFYPSGAADPADALTPSGALIKATLLNAAVDMAGVNIGINNYPNDREGWGRLLLDNGLHFAGQPRSLFLADVRNADGLGTGEFDTYSFSVTSSAEPLRITLVWTEPPAAINAPAGSVTINDLDLQVLEPGALTYLGNVFDTSAGESQTGGSPDPINNVEQIHLPNPAAGNYLITITGSQVNQGTQGYALVVTGAVQTDAPDCNGNGIPDSQDIAGGTSSDCDANDQPDECDPDCDGDATPDACEAEPDCNQNGTPDSCDLNPGTSQDCNGNAIPDECDLIAPTALVTTPVTVDPPLAIPNNPSVSTHTFTMPESGTIVDVNLELHIVHTWNGDLVGQVSHGGQTATLINRVGQSEGAGDGTDNNGFQIVLDDQAPANIHDADSGGGLLAGTHQPDDYTQGPVPASPLSVFDGLDQDGDWTVTLSDYFTTSDDGTLTFWALHITTATGTASSDTNGDGIPDECQHGNGDCTGDGVVNLLDFATFAICFSESRAGRTGHCLCADLDGDGDTDLLDFATFAIVFNQ